MTEPGDAAPPTWAEAGQVLRTRRLAAGVCLLWLVVGLVGGIAISFAASEQPIVVRLGLHVLTTVVVAGPIAVWLRREVLRQRER